jgi:uncharacterized membrane protein YkvA (DUF1232 family)
MTNIFYHAALGKAAGLLGRHTRMALLLSQLAVKLNNAKKKDLSVQAVSQKISVLTRLVKSYTTGHYRNVPWKPVAAILGSFIYFLNPFDLIPDVAPVVGLTDDFSILVWVYGSVQTEIDKFLAWEQSQLSLS